MVMARLRYKACVKQFIGNFLKYVPKSEHGGYMSPWSQVPTGWVNGHVTKVGWPALPVWVKIIKVDWFVRSQWAVVLGLS